MTAVYSSQAVTLAGGEPSSLTPGPNIAGPGPDLDRLRAGVELLMEVTPDARLLALKNLIVNNDGIWTVPENPDDYQPVHYEAEFGGVSAIAERPEDLPRLWIKNASWFLNALERPA